MGMCPKEDVEIGVKPTRQANKNKHFMGFILKNEDV